MKSFIPVIIIFIQYIATSLYHQVLNRREQFHMVKFSYMSTPAHPPNTIYDYSESLTESPQHIEVLLLLHIQKGKKSPLELPCNIYIIYIAKPLNINTSSFNDKEINDDRGKRDSQDFPPVDSAWVYTNLENYISKKPLENELMNRLKSSKVFLLKSIQEKSGDDYYLELKVSGLELYINNSVDLYASSALRRLEITFTFDKVDSKELEYNMNINVNIGQEEGLSVYGKKMINKPSNQIEALVSTGKNRLRTSLKLYKPFTFKISVKSIKPNNTLTESPANILENLIYDNDESFNDVTNGELDEGYEMLGEFGDASVNLEINPLSSTCGDEDDELDFDVSSLDEDEEDDFEEKEGNGLENKDFITVGTSKEENHMSKKNISPLMLLVYISIGVIVFLATIALVFFFFSVKKYE